LLSLQLREYPGEIVRLSSPKFGHAGPAKTWISQQSEGAGSNAGCRFSFTDKETPVSNI